MKRPTVPRWSAPWRSSNDLRSRQIVHEGSLAPRQRDAYPIAGAPLCFRPRYVAVKRTLLILVALLTAAYAIVSIFLRPAPAGGDFTLRSTHGPVSLRDFHGEVVLIYFGYVSCPDVCPTSLSVAAKAMSALSPAERDRARLLFVSVDPERDTLEATERYANFFHPRFSGLVGSPEEIAAAAKKYGARYAKAPIPSAVGYAVDHTADIYVVAPSGRLHGSVPHGAGPEDVVRAIRAAQKEIHWP